MAVLHRVVGGLKALIGRRRAEQELDEELQAYLESSIEARVRAGVPADEARRAARIEMGSLDAVKDHTRDVGWETTVEQTWRDVRYAARTLRKSPAFSVVVVLTLTLGIGANTAIFSAVNAIMLRSLPAERPDELVSIKAIYPNGTEPFSYAAYRRLAADGAAFVDVLAASPARRDAIAIDDAPEAVELKWVSGNYFTTLGVSMSAGRPLLPPDDPQPPGVAVAVISDAFWARRLGRDPAVVGRTVRLKGTPFVVVGVASRGFASETPGESVDFWMPLSAQPGAPTWLWSGHSTTWLSLLGRRRPGVDLTQARASLEPVYERLRADVAGTDNSQFRQSVLDSRLSVSEARHGVSRVRDNLAAPLAILMAIVGLVLLVACANVASLMLTRAASRRREIATALALGAGRPRVIRQGMIEALLLAALGGAGGFLLAVWGTSVLSSLLAEVLPVVLDIRPDGRVLLFAAAMSCATAALVGVLPTISATRLDALVVLRSGGGPARGASRIPFGRTLVVSQIAVSLVLLVAAGLFVRNLAALGSVALGFDPNRVVLFRVNVQTDQQPVGNAGRREIYQRLLERASAVPGVENASGSFSGVLSPDTWRNVIAIEGVTPPDGRPLRSFVNTVTPTYFDVMRMAVLRGRHFDDADREGAKSVAIVNDAFARRFLASRDVLAGRVGLCTSETCGPSTTGDMMEIVGVVEDARQSDLREPAPPMVYVPFAQTGRIPREIQVRTAGDPATVASTLYRVLANADRRMTILGMTTARERVHASLATEDTVARVSSIFGLLALALAAVGLSGLVAYMTTQRTQEIGIRMALGADRRAIRRLVLGGTGRLVVTGAALGFVAALGVARLLSGLLYQVGPYDPLVLSLSLGVLVVTTLIAGYLPAARASRVDPVSALRAE